MRLATSCPACNAAFYVLPDQLAAHRGDLRCGKCEHVFNALDRLAEIADEETTNKPEPSTQAPIIEEEFVPADIEIIAESDVTISVEFETAIPAESLEKSAKGAGILSQEPPAISITDYSIPASASILSPTMMDDAARNKTGKPSSSSRSGFAKRLIFLVALILLLAGSAQAVYYLRSDIAARWPQYRPILEQACQYVQCKVELPMNADLIVIDDSDLQEDLDRQGLIHLYTTLINTASYAQAYPLLELTLTDVNDKPLLRRTFKPQEYLPAEADIKRGVLAKQEINIKLSLTASGEAVSGYRLFVTY
jgi:predicted Zn finger-like uncharacterized protein